MWLADSNILIRAASAPEHPLQEWLQNHLPGTRLEAGNPQYQRLRLDCWTNLRCLGWLCHVKRMATEAEIRGNFLSSAKPKWRTHEPP